MLMISTTSSVVCTETFLSANSVIFFAKPLPSVFLFLNYVSFIYVEASRQVPLSVLTSGRQEQNT